MEVLRWCITVPLAFFGLWILLGNWVVFIGTAFTKRPTSLTPILGGVFVAAALVACPLAGTTWWWWAPLATDLSIIAFAVVGIYWILGRQVPSA